MGWACTVCGNINTGAKTSCEDCGEKQGAARKPRLEAQPINPNMLWVATLLGGALGGFALAAWNLWALKRGNIILYVAYTVLGVGGLLLTLVIIAKMTPAYGIAFSLSLGFLLVSIPYNRDKLHVLQWTWAHPVRRFVLAVVPTRTRNVADNQPVHARRQPRILETIDSAARTVAGVRVKLTYVSFADGNIDLFGYTSLNKPWIALSILPLIVVVISLAVGYGTLTLGNALA